MQITLSTPTTLRLDFAFNKAIIERVKQIPGYAFDDKERCWFVPVAQLRRCEELFPKAQYGADVWSAEADAMRVSAAQLFAMLQRSGAAFRVTEDDIVLVEGECVSPLVADLVAERSAWFRPHVENSAPHDVFSADEVPTGVETQNEASEGVTAIQATRNDELLAKSIAGAVKAEKRKEQYRREWWQQRSIFELEAEE